MPAQNQSPQAILPRFIMRFLPFGRSAGFIKAYTNGVNLDTFFLDLPAAPAKQVVLNNQTGVTIQAKLSTHNAADNDSTTSVDIPDGSFYTFDVVNASDIAIRRADANGTKAAVQVTFEVKL